MEAKILRQDGTLGKILYKFDVPADMYKIRDRLDDKPLIGVGRWKNANESFFCILPCKTFNTFLSVEIVREILEWMENIEEED